MCAFCHQLTSRTAMTISDRAGRNRARRLAYGEDEVDVLLFPYRALIAGNEQVGFWHW